jgi:hypothetical protein
MEIREGLAPRPNELSRAELVGESLTSCTIGHGFFPVTDGAGNVPGSSPETVKRY